MSDYIVSARKYRPLTFSSVVGQKSLVQTLRNSIQSGKLAHAYLFCGPRGVGKTTCARIFAKTINCTNRTAEGEACDACESCISFNEQRSLNIHELDAASNNGVDSIRELIEQVQIPPQIGRYKVFIIDEVHMLSTGAFNAFLKTLEEPPSHAVFILATTEKQKILPTILSRCQTYDFQRISIQDIADQLAWIAGQENVTAEPQALQVLARKADGGMRDALSLFDQIVSFTQGQVTYEAVIRNLNILDYETYFRMTDAALQCNIPAALMILDNVIRRGFDAQYFIGGWAAHLRDLMVSKDAATASLIEAGQEMAQKYMEQASKCDNKFLYYALQIANECDFNYRNSRNKRLSVEIAIIRICSLLAPASTAGPQLGANRAPHASDPLPSFIFSLRGPKGVPFSVPVVAPATQGNLEKPKTPAAPAAPVSPAPQPADPRPAMKPVTGGSRFAPRNSTAGAVRGGSRLSVLNVGETAPVVRAEVEEEMNEPFTAENLRREWRGLETVIQKNILKALIHGFIPEQVDDTHFVVKVISESQRDIIEAGKPEMMRIIRRKLRNTHIEIAVEILPQDAQRPAFTPQEKFNEMEKTNSEPIRTLVELFNLEIV